VFSKVKVKRGALNHFRKLAREAFPLEIQAVLVGKIISVNEVEIVKFVYAKEYATQTGGSVQWYQAEFDKVKEQAAKMDLRVVGDIHTHPSWDAVMSKSDYEACITEQLSICGIVSVLKNKTRVRFWVPTSSLQCKIVYL